MRLSAILTTEQLAKLILSTACNWSKWPRCAPDVARFSSLADSSSATRVP
jgi:hypothetical protein